VIKTTQRLFNKVRKTEIIKVFSLTSISTLIKMLTGFISIKVVAVIIGPSGIALLGQLNNFSSIAMTAASGGINSGITKYVAEYKESPNKVRLFISTALQITLILSLFCGLLFILFSRALSSLILSNISYSYVFTLFGITLTLYTLNNLLMSIINGYKEFKNFVNISIINSIAGVIFTVILVFIWQLKGALISAVTYQSIGLFITIFMVSRSPWFVSKNFKVRFSKLVLKKYLSFSLMTLVTAATVPVSQLFLRTYVIEHLSTTEAGWWEAMNRISGMYLMVITSSFGVYYLPRLSEIKDKKELKKEILTAYKIIIPILVVGFTAIYFLRDLIIQILFTKEFYPMRDLFIWQLIGDMFKIATWLIGVSFIAKSLTKLYIFNEIFFSILFVVLGVYLINYFNIKGLTIAYMINYLVNMLFMVIIFKKIILK
jgi:O-antigen/teichoic acid export membrane protein